MHRRRHGGTFARMPLWMLTIAICASVWVLGTILVVAGATWLVHHQPD